MSKDIEMKMHLLDMLKSMLLEGAGKGVKGMMEAEPVEEEVEVIPLDPEHVEEEGIEDAADDALLEHLASKEVEESEDDEENPKRRKTLQEFLASK